MLRIKKEMLNKIFMHAEKEAPKEACGIIAGKIAGDEKIALKLYPCKNVAESSFRYRISPEELISVFNKIEKENLKLIAFYHSHPFAEVLGLSEIDKKEATWYGVSYIIVSPKTKKLASWFLSDNGFEKEQVAVEE